jgi:phosphate butyryltransferase
MSGIGSVAELITQVKEVAKVKRPVRAALIGTGYELQVEATMQAAADGMIYPTCIGDEDQINEAAEKFGLDQSHYAVEKAAGCEEAITTALRLLFEEKIDLFIKGDYTVREFLVQLSDREAGFRLNRALVSHVAVIEHKKYPRLLLLSDAVTNIAPSASAKLAIINNAAKVANLLGISMPKVALLAAVEVIYPQMPVTMEEAAISKMCDKGQIKNCLIDGPLSMDVATVPEVAEQKGAKSAVAGQADILIGDRLEVSNGVYKAMALFAGAKTSGIIIGGKVPIALSARIESRESRLASIALGALAA